MVPLTYVEPEEISNDIEDNQPLQDIKQDKDKFPFLDNFVIPVVH
jgi:hypothetical protein